MPGLVQFHEKYPDFPLFMLNVVDGTKETARSGFKFLKDNNYDLPNFTVEEQTAMERYGLRRFSLLLAYDKNGRLIQSYTSFDLSELEDLARQLTD